ncbi:MAG: UbiA family prenyltransferase [Desulfotignum sp.]
MNMTPAVLTDHLRIFSEITKLHLTFFIALSAVFGQVIASALFTRDTLAAGGGVWLLAAGAAVLNNIQDRDHDCWFARTQHRCLPQKKIRVSTAAVLALVLTSAGLAILFRYPDTPVPGLLGLLALGCYNGLYTPLKKKSCLAVWPGVACGMLPPAIGWSMVPSWASTGTGRDLLLVMMVLGLWQVPHFLALRAGTKIKDSRVPKNTRTPMDGRRFKEDGSCFRPHPHSVFPCLAGWWTHTELQVQVLIWVSLYSLAMLLFLIHGGVASATVSMGLGAMAMALPAGMACLQLRCRGRPKAAGFAVINLSLFVFMVLGILDRAVTGFFPFQ